MGQSKLTRRRFTDEFKRDAVELVRTSGKPIAQVADELGIYDSTLGDWVKHDREQKYLASSRLPLKADRERIGATITAAR